jgi:hypothetical protein
MLKFDLSVTDDFDRVWAKAQDEMMRHARRGVEAGVKAGILAAHPHVPRRTGELADTAVARVTGENRLEVRGEMRWPKNYASFVDKGTKPHPITARRVPLLHFYWEKVGDWVKFKQVKHPGTKPVNFTEYAEDKFLEIALEHIAAGARAMQHILR